ncbi:acyltransferase family protein [Escherichia coli]|uniref:acyltransferase family protein n=1 Tax=Escherichia coli TaxID=562 RepID=UPI001C3836F8|nr:acyltransferase family protein [Escherichia coli]MBV2402347.1 acyltransferase [Escherichia coli]
MIKEVLIKQLIMEMLKYRADIDGLRAIAVLLVVLYHAGFKIPGGFVGVDVFFVISGFLITTIIDREIREELFSYRAFYLRRIKRLIPALFFMIVVVSAYCSYYLLPDDLISYSKTAILSMLGVSNFYFYANTNYFDSSAFEPLLHTWSLAVEEQYYIIWPALLILLYKSSKASIKTFSMSILFFGSITLSWYYVYQDKNLAYMMLPFRFFELMAGALTAINFRTFHSIANNNQLLSLTGALLIFLSAFYISDSSFFPGILALPVVIGSCLIIVVDKGVVSKFLSIPPIVYIGKISYSFYLWHWPIIILAKYRGIELTTYNAFMLVILSLIAASFSYHFIETPFRKLKSWKVAYTALYATPLAVVFIFSYVIVANDGYRSRISGLLNELDDSNTAHIIRSQCIGPMKVGNIDECHLGVKKEKIDGVLLGDSFGNAYTGFVDVLAKDAGLMIHDTTRSSTPTIPGIFVSSITKPVSDEAANAIIKYNDNRTKFASSQKIVIISDFWGQYTEKNPEFRVFDKERKEVSKNSFQLRTAYIKSLIDNGTKVFIIARPFSGVGSSTMATLRNDKLHHVNLNKITFGYGEDKDKRVEYRLKKELPLITIIDPNDVLCNSGKCHASISGDLLYRKDGYHLNYSSSEKLGFEYIKKYGNPLKSL